MMAPVLNGWRASTALCALGATLVLPACGGTDEGRPSPPKSEAATAVDSCAAFAEQLAQGWEFQTIVDFEPAGGDESRERIPFACAAATPCAFYFNYDDLNSPKDPAMRSGCGGNGVAVDVNQEAGDGPTAFRIPEPRCDASLYAYHQQGKNIAVCTNEVTGRQGWGATLAITFNANANNKGLSDMPYDASAWDGIAAWVRRGETPSNSAFLVSAKDQYTAPPPAESKRPAYCLTADMIPDAQKCDPFGRAVLLEPEWRFVKLPFSLLQQKGYGTPSPLGHVDPSQLAGLELGFAAGDWDVWIDDLAFYREPR